MTSKPDLYAALIQDKNEVELLILRLARLTWEKAVSDRTLPRSIRDQATADYGNAIARFTASLKGRQPAAVAEYRLGLQKFTDFTVRGTVPEEPQELAKVVGL